MKIGFDLSNIANNKSGILRANYNIYKNLIIPKSQIYVFSFSNIRNKIEYNKNYFYFLSKEIRFVRFFWYNFILPFQLYFKGINIFFCNQRIPILNLNLNYVLVYHDFTWKNFPKSMRYSNYLLDKFLSKISLKKANLIITPSKSIKKELINYSKKLKKKIHVVNWGGEISPPKKNQFKIKKNLLFVGKFEPRKNLPLLIKAYYYLSNNLKKKHKLIIVGSKGWGLMNIREYVKELNLIKYVKIYENISDKKLEYFYKSSLYTVLLSKYEGYGLPIIESLNYGTPVIVSSIPTLKEISGNCGIKVKTNNIKQITNKLNKAITDKKLYQKLQKNINKKILPTWKKSGKRVSEILIKNLNL